MMLGSNYIASIALLFLLRSSHCSSLAIERKTNLPEPQFNGTQRSPDHCGFTGNPDLYGIGIRLGYYTQALSVWFANYFVLSEAKGLRSVNLLFLVALFIALAWLSHRPQQTYAIEVFLLLRLLFATWYVGVLDRSRFSKKHAGKRIVRIVVRESALLGMLGYAVWFAWIGLDRMERTPCGTWIFFAARLDLYGTYRSAYKVLSISALSFGTIKQCDTANQLFQHWRHTDIRSPDYFARLRQALLEEHGQNEISWGDSCAAQHSHKVLDEDGRLVKDSESEPPSSSHPTVLIRDEVDESASIGSCHTSTSPSVQSEIPRRNVCDAATQCHLPKTPPHPPKTPYINSPKRKPNLPANGPALSPLPSLSSLIEAERYLDAITATNAADHSTWCYQIPHLPMRIFLPRLPSPTHLRKRLSTLYAQRPFRFVPILVPLARHVRSLCKHGWLTYPLMLEAALRDPAHKRVSESALAAAIALRRAQLPRSRPGPHVVWSAAVALAVCVELVLGVELSVRWNAVRGVADVGAPGQLIPAVVGIGGLVRVVWVWWSRDGGEVEGGGGDGVEGELRECVEVYQRLREESGDLVGDG